MSRTIKQVLRSIDTPMAYDDKGDRIYVYYGGHRVGVILEGYDEDNQRSWQYHSLPRVERLKVTSERYGNLDSLKNFLEASDT